MISNNEARLLVQSDTPSALHAHHQFIHRNVLTDSLRHQHSFQEPYEFAEINPLIVVNVLLKLMFKSHDGIFERSCRYESVYIHDGSCEQVVDLTIMNDSSNSIASLMDENKDLRFEIEQQLNIIESQKQELHSANRKLETLNKMKVEMEIEIEALTGLHQIKGNLETKVKNLEAELSSTKLKCTSLETELQSEKANHELAVCELNSEITNLKKEDQNVESREEQQKEEFQMKLSLLQETNNVLSSSNFDLQNDKKGLTDKMVLLELTVNEKNREVEELKQMLETKSNELKSALKLVEELQEEKAVLNAELTTLKCHPITANGKRGNSLFAEVDDKRLSVSRELEAFKNKYRELKKSFMKKNAELKALEADNIQLRKQWQNDQNTPYESMASLVETHKVRIQELSHLVSILEKRPESPQLINLSGMNNRNFDCIKDLVDTERKVNQELRQEMEKISIQKLSQGEEIFKLTQERRLLRAQTMKDAATIAELKIKMESKMEHKMEL